MLRSVRKRRVWNLTAISWALVFLKRDWNCSVTEDGTVRFRPEEAGLRPAPTKEEHPTASSGFETGPNPLPL